jgi:mono/diheme cytochrome c family protein
VTWALVHVRLASIGRHATETPPLALDDPAVVRAGARAFSERGCISCHGAPGVTWAKFSEGLHPGPPELKDVVGNLEPRELFWVIKNGINMTGMPSFGPTGVSDQEIWTIVAFIKKLPSVSAEDFKAWSAPAG